MIEFDCYEKDLNEEVIPDGKSLLTFTIPDICLYRYKRKDGTYLYADTIEELRKKMIGIL